MAIPGALVFGVIEYVCGYLILSLLLLACAFVFGIASRTLQRFKSRSAPKDMAQWN